MIAASATQPTGRLGLSVVRGGRTTPVVAPSAPGHALSTSEILAYGFPQRGLPAEVNEWRLSNVANIRRGMRTVGRGRRAARRHGLPHLWSQLWLQVIRGDGQVVDLGLAGMRVVTTVGVNFIVDAFQNIVELETMKYHGIGTTNTAEAAGDTALAAELTTVYNPDSTRATGTTVEGASANIFRTVGTNTVDGTAAIVEHGIFNQAATGGGVLLDRTVFATVNLASGDSLQTTYELTVTAGG